MILPCPLSIRKRSIQPHLAEQAEAPTFSVELPVLANNYIIVDKY